MASPLLVAVPADIRELENYSWHATTDTYLAAVLEAAGAVPAIVPAMSEHFDADALLERFDGVLTTGSVTNVHPKFYGVEPSPAHEPYDEARDTLSVALIKGAARRGMPLLAICRGHQEMNVALGGTLATNIQEIEGRSDHRAPEGLPQAERYAIRQSVHIEPGGLLEGILGTDEIRVNSVHKQAVDRPGDDVFVEARALDGTIEAISLGRDRGFALGLQWHPEFWVRTDPPSAAIFRAFGEACRAYRGS